MRRLSKVRLFTYLPKIHSQLQEVLQYLKKGEESST